LRAYTDALERAMGEIVARARGEIELLKERSAAIVAATDARAREAELRLVELERSIAERLSAVKDGERGRDGEPGPPGERGPPGESIQGPAGPPGRDADPDEIAAAVARAVEAIPKPRDGEPGPQGERGPPGERGEDGRSVDPADVLVMVREVVSALPPAPQGERGEPGRDGEAGPPGKDGIPGERGPAGFLSEVRAWEDRIHYAGAVVAHDGGSWQAVRDTGKAPPHDDWICIAARGADGRDGHDGRSLVPRGTWREGESYKALEFVAFNGASFVAKRDEPGPCPGDGWQLLSGVGKRGDRGERGERGLKGDRGEPGASVIAIDVDGDGLLTLTNADGSTVQCDLYPLLSKLGA